MNENEVVKEVKWVEFCNGKPTGREWIKTTYDDSKGPKGKKITEIMDEIFMVAFFILSVIGMLCVY